MVLASRWCGLPSKSVNSAPRAVTVTTSPSSTKTIRRVSPRIAVTSDAMKFSPSPSPTTMGELFLAATRVSGCWSDMTTNAYAPWTLASARRTAVVRSGAPAASARSMRWANSSVSVSDVIFAPAAVSSARSARWFSMMPLWMTETEPTRCGWAFSSDGRPWVAQRVCPMPIEPGAGSLTSLSSRFDSLPRHRTTRVAPSFQTATPAES